MLQTKDAPNQAALTRLYLERLLNTEHRRRDWIQRNQLFAAYPDAGPLAREYYGKHLEFFAAGAVCNERLFMGGNRTGKTYSGAYEKTLHLTGRYPDWWPGKRFDGPTIGWSVGETAKDVRDTMQLKMLGMPGEFGTGLIPAGDIIRTPPKSGVPDAVDTIFVRHISGGTSKETMKSYDQGRKSFQSAELHHIWLDEESPKDIYGECLLRIMTTDGVMYLTFTPILGLTPLVHDFMREANGENE